MSTEVVSSEKIQSPTSSLDPEKRPGYLSLSPYNSPSHQRQPSSGKIAPNSDSPSSDGGLGGSEREMENESVESSHRSSSGISSCSANSPEEDYTGELECSLKRSIYKNKGSAASWPLSHTENGVYKMFTKARLQKLLTEMAWQDESYSGLNDSPLDPVDTESLSLGEGPRSFSPFEGTPSSQPPSLFSNSRAASLDSPFYHMSSLTSRDGVTSPTGAESLPQKRGGVWTLNLIDGNLFLFRANPNSEVPMDSKVEMEGIELAKLLTKKLSGQDDTDDPQDCYYYHLPYTIFNLVLNNPRISPVYMPAKGDKYSIVRQNDPQKMTPTEFILHHQEIFLVLEEDKDPPVLTAKTQDEMIALLEKLAEEKKSYFDASYNIVVNIKSDSGHKHSHTQPNNIAIYFTGKKQKYRYYVTVDSTTSCLTVLRKPLPLPPDDWTNHLEFSNTYFTPPMAMGAPDNDLSSIPEEEKDN